MSRSNHSSRKRVYKETAGWGLHFLSKTLLTLVERMFGVIFDMDGVLLDAAPLLWGSYKDVVREHGGVLSDDDLPSYRGVSWPDAVARINEEFNMQLDVESFSSRLIQKEKEAFTKEKYVMPGLVEFLDDLKKHHVPMAVGTSSGYDRAADLLGRGDIRNYFSAIASANDAKHHKPAPDIFLVAAQRLNLNPKDCIVIEDGSSGVEAAHRAGMKAIGFAQDDDNRNALHNADLLIRDFSELSYEKLTALLR